MEPAVMPGRDITAHRPGLSPPPLRVWVSLNVPETHAGPTGCTRLWKRGQFCVSREHSPRWLCLSTSSPEQERSCQSERGRQRNWAIHRCPSSGLGGTTEQK